MFSLRTDLLTAVAQARSSDETRHYLKGVFVTPRIDPETGHGVLMVATDGHIMAVAYDRWGSAPHDMIVDTDFKSKDLKRPAREEGVRRLVFPHPGAAEIRPMQSEHGITEDAGGLTKFIAVAKIDARFPPFWKMAPKLGSNASSVPTRCFDTGLLNRASKAFKLAGCGDSFLNITQVKPNDPAIATSNDPKIPLFFVVMPARSNFSGLPDCADRISPEQMAAE